MQQIPLWASPAVCNGVFPYNVFIFSASPSGILAANFPYLKEKCALGQTAAKLK